MKHSIKRACYIMMGVAMIACNSYDFEQEQYKNEVYLLSNSNLIYDRQVAELKQEGDTIYLMAGLSGTLNADKPFKVALIEADSLFKAYNKSNYDIETDRYARLLPGECYTVPSLEGQILVGETQVKFPVYLHNLDKLSPDSIYFLNYK
ncbi:MAG: DUF1735 domain-containing protein, partial [Proteiniphilum sp.]